MNSSFSIPQSSLSSTKAFLAQRREKRDKICNKNKDNINTCKNQIEILPSEEEKDNLLIFNQKDLNSNKKKNNNNNTENVNIKMKIKVKNLSKVKDAIPLSPHLYTAKSSLSKEEDKYPATQTLTSYQVSTGRKVSIPLFKKIQNQAADENPNNIDNMKEDHASKEKLQKLRNQKSKKKLSRYAMLDILAKEWTIS